jgi:uncharacterized protein YjbI with pentapeptide repeats
MLSRIDKFEMKADMRAADMKMELFRNETKAEMRAADLKMVQLRNETRLYNACTLFVAIFAIVAPFLLKKS